MSLFLAGLELQPTNARPWHFWLPQGMDDVPSVRGGSEIVPFRSGRLNHRRTADKRQLVLEGHVLSDTLRASIDMLKTVLNPSDDPVPLVWIDPLGQADPRWTLVTVQNVMATVPSPVVRKYSIELEADPFWYSPWGSLTLDASLALDEDYLLDSSAELVVTPTSSSHLVSIVDLGTAPTERIRVRLIGPSVGVVGVETADTTPIGFTYPALTAGQELLVDADLRSVTLGGANVRGSMTLKAGNQHSEYLRFAPTAQDIRILGQPAEARLIFSTTWL